MRRNRLILLRTRDWVAKHFRNPTEAQWGKITPPALTSGDITQNLEMRFTQHCVKWQNILPNSSAATDSGAWRIRKIREKMILCSHKALLEYFHYSSSAFIKSPKRRDFTYLWPDVLHSCSEGEHWSTFWNWFSGRFIAQTVVVYTLQLWKH